MGSEYVNREWRWLADHRRDAWRFHEMVIGFSRDGGLEGGTRAGVLHSRSTDNWNSSPPRSRKDPQLIIPRTCLSEGCYNQKSKPRLTRTYAPSTQFFPFPRPSRYFLISGISLAHLSKLSGRQTFLRS